MARKVSEETDTKHLFKRGNIWWIQAMRNGVKFVKTTGTSVHSDALTIRDRELHPMALKDNKDIAENLLGKISSVERQLEVAKNSLAATTIKEGWATYLEQHTRPDSGPVTLKNYECWYESFSSWMETTYPDVLELRHVTKEHAEKYADHLLTKVAPTTFNRHIFFLSLLWRILETVARITVSPWKTITRKRVVVHSRRELTLEELKDVCKAAKGEMRLLIAIGIYCGLRLGDAALLQWSNVDIIKRVISLIPMKTARRSQKRISLPIHLTLYEMLVLCPEKNRRGYVMPSLAARYQSFHSALSKDVAKLFQSVDIVTTSETEGVGRNRADCGYHSLRHTFVSLCASGGVPQSVVQSLVGHGSPAMTQHYTHIGLQTAQNAIALLPHVAGKKGVEKKNDAALKERKKQLTGRTDKGLKQLVASAEKEIQKREKAKKSEPIDVEEIAKTEKTS